MKVEFLKALLERAVKTFCQSLVAMLGAGAVNILEVPWQAALSVSLGAAVISVLTSIGSSGFGNEGPSLAGERLEPEPPAAPPVPDTWEVDPPAPGFDERLKDYT
jgi:hypothetical protein